MGENLDRLIQKGDIVIFMPPNGNVKAVKNLTIGKEYFVDDLVVRNQEWKKMDHTHGKFVDVSPHVDTVSVINDKGVKFSYSAKHFLIAAEGVHFSLEQVEQKGRDEFLSGLKDL